MTPERRFNPMLPVTEEEIEGGRQSPIARTRSHAAIKQVTIKIFQVGGKKFTTHRLRAPNGKCFREAGIEGVVMEAAAKLEELMPNEEYSLVDLGDGRFNFVWRKTKEATDAQS